jgi:inositol-phosphate phosphatase/L-galactose 1-phosphate phosphatase/histidinol-phosphatase
MLSALILNPFPSAYRLTVEEISGAQCECRFDTTMDPRKNQHEAVASFTAGRNLQKLILLAERLADCSGAILRRHFRRPTTLVCKDDGSPVTPAEQEVEATLRSMICREMPEDGIIGEELEDERSNSDWVWMIDPIDGTKSYLSGLPIFGTLISLSHRNVPVIGIIDQPILGERWLGIEGHPTTFNGQLARTSSRRDIPSAKIFATAPEMFLGAAKRPWQRLTHSAKIVRYGADCYAYGLLAIGFIDAVVETNLRVHDYNAHWPVVVGAGGCVSDWKGKPLSGVFRSNIVASANASLHDAILNLLNQ